MEILSWLRNIPRYFAFWVLIDIIYIFFISSFLGTGIPLSLSQFIGVHFLATRRGNHGHVCGAGRGGCSGYRS